MFMCSCASGRCSLDLRVVACIHYNFRISEHLRMMANDHFNDNSPSATAEGRGVPTL